MTSISTKNRLNELLSEHYALIGSAFATVYLLAVILISRGLRTSDYTASIGVIWSITLFLIAFIQINSWLRPDEPKRIDLRSRVLFLRTAYLFRWIAVIMPSALAAIWVYCLLSGGLAPFAMLQLGISFELAYIIFHPVWRGFRDVVLGLPPKIGVAAYSWLSSMLLGECNKDGLRYLSRALDQGRQSLSEEGVNSSDLERLQLVIPLFETHDFIIPFSQFSELAIALSYFPLYRRFSETARDFLSHPSSHWVEHLDSVKPTDKIATYGLIVGVLSLVITTITNYLADLKVFEISTTTIPMSIFGVGLFFSALLLMVPVISRINQAVTDIPRTTHISLAQSHAEDNHHPH